MTIATSFRPQGLDADGEPIPLPRAILTQRSGNGTGFRGDRRSGSYGGVPLNNKLRRHPPVPVSDSISWLPNFQRVDRIHLEHSQADYEHSSKLDVHDEYLIPEALKARSDSARNSRLGHQWHTNTFHTISKLTCEYPNTTQLRSRNQAYSCQSHDMKSTFIKSYIYALSVLKETSYPMYRLVIRSLWF